MIVKAGNDAATNMVIKLRYMFYINSILYYAIAKDHVFQNKQTKEKYLGKNVSSSFSQNSQKLEINQVFINRRKETLTKLWYTMKFCSVVKKKIKLLCATT